MEIKYQISEDDFIAAAALCRRKQNRAFFFLQVIGGCLLAYFLYELWVGIIPLRSLWGGVIPAMLFFMPFWVTYQFRRVYRKSVALQEPRTMIAESEGLSFKSQSVNAQVAWSNYASFVEDKRSFALVQQGNQIFVPIPKRELSGAQIEELRSFFEQHIARR